MATIALPYGYKVRRAQAGFERAQGSTVSPYSLRRQVQVWGGVKRFVSIEVPPINKTNAAGWATFFESLNGMENTFNLDLTNLYPNDATATSVPMRLVDPSFSWDIDTALVYGFSFNAEEVL